MDDDVDFVPFNDSTVYMALAHDYDLADDIFDDSDSLTSDSEEKEFLEREREHKEKMKSMCFIFRADPFALQFTTSGQTRHRIERPAKPHTVPPLLHNFWASVEPKKRRGRLVRQLPYQGGMELRRSSRRLHRSSPPASRPPRTSITPPNSPPPSVPCSSASLSQTYLPAAVKSEVDEWPRNELDSEQPPSSSRNLASYDFIRMNGLPVAHNGRHQNDVDIIAHDRPPPSSQRLGVNISQAPTIFRGPIYPSTSSFPDPSTLQTLVYPIPESENARNPGMDSKIITLHEPSPFLSPTSPYEPAAYSPNSVSGSSYNRVTPELSGRVSEESCFSNSPYTPLSNPPTYAYPEFGYSAYPYLLQPPSVPPWPNSHSVYSSVGGNIF